MLTAPRFAIVQPEGGRYECGPDGLLRGGHAPEEHAGGSQSVRVEVGSGGGGDGARGRGGRGARRGPMYKTMIIPCNFARANTTV